MGAFNTLRDGATELKEKFLDFVDRNRQRLVAAGAVGALVVVMACSGAEAEGGTDAESLPDEIAGDVFYDTNETDTSQPRHTSPPLRPKTQPTNCNRTDEWKQPEQTQAMWDAYKIAGNDPTAQSRWEEVRETTLDCGPPPDPDRPSDLLDYHGDILVGTVTLQCATLNFGNELTAADWDHIGAACFNASQVG